MTTEYTQNFRLNLPDFRMGPWHDLVNNNTITIDQLLMSLYGGVDTRPWANNTYFEVGMTAIDTVDNTFWVCSVSHTSAGAPVTFAEDRAAHPDYWARVVVGVAPRGEWTNDTLYLPNDMATDSNEGIIGICIDQHTSSAFPATMRDDATHWSFLTDFGSSSLNAIDVDYDNTASGATGTNVQIALDELFENDENFQIALGALSDALDDLEIRVDNTENKNAAQDLAIIDLESAVNQLQLDVAAIQGATIHAIDVVYAPTSTEPFTDVQTGIEYLYATDGALDARIDDLENADSASVFVGDNPPGSPAENSLWWESDTGVLYIYYNDGSSSQWVAVLASNAMLGAVRYDAAQALTTNQQVQARKNIYAAPFDALAYNGMQVNGSMDVSQERGTVANAANGYPADNWFMYRDGTMAVAAAQGPTNDVPGISNIVYIAITTAQASLTASNQVMLFQNIEGYRVARLAWGTAKAQPLTIGFWTAHTRPGVYSVAIFNGGGGGDRGYATTYTQNVGAVFQYNVITIPGDTAGTWAKANTSGMQLKFCMAASAGATAPSANTWYAGNPSAAPGQINGVAATSDVFRITGVVVLPGIDAPTAAQSPLIMRPFDQELPTCQRYFQHVNTGLQVWATVNGFYSINSLYPVTMRAAPTATLVNTIQNVGFNSPIMENVVQDCCRMTAQANITGQAGFQHVMKMDARL